MPKYECPLCHEKGFDSMYDIQHHAVRKHGKNVEAIVYPGLHDRVRKEKVVTVKPEQVTLSSPKAIKLTEQVTTSSTKRSGHELD